MLRYSAFQRPQRIAINLLKGDTDAVSGLLDALDTGEEYFSDSELDGRVTCNTRSQGIERFAAVCQTQQKCGVEVEMDGTGKLAVIVDLRTFHECDIHMYEMTGKTTLHSSGIKAAKSASCCRKCPFIGTKLQQRC